MQSVPFKSSHVQFLVQVPFKRSYADIASKAIYVYAPWGCTAAVFEKCGFTQGKHRFWEQMPPKPRSSKLPPAPPTFRLPPPPPGPPLRQFFVTHRSLLYVSSRREKRAAKGTRTPPPGRPQNGPKGTKRRQKARFGTLLDFSSFSRAFRALFRGLFCEFSIVITDENVTGAYSQKVPKIGSRSSPKTLQNEAPEPL